MWVTDTVHSQPTSHVTPTHPHTHSRRRRPDSVWGRSVRPPRGTRPPFRPTHGYTRVTGRPEDGDTCVRPTRLEPPADRHCPDRPRPVHPGPAWAVVHGTTVSPTPRYNDPLTEDTLMTSETRYRSDPDPSPPPVGRRRVLEGRKNPHRTGGVKGDCEDPRSGRVPSLHPRVDDSGGS